MAKPKIGLSMLYCLSQPFEEMIEQLTKHGLKYAELVDDGFHTLDKKRVSVLRDLSRSLDVKFSVHAPFADINIASPSKPMLNAMLRRLRQSIESASQLDASTWVFHPGATTGISFFYPGMDWLQNLKTVRTLTEIAGEHGVRIGIENVPEPHPFLMKNVNDFERFFAEFDGDLGLVLDVGHANINGQTEAFLKSFPSRIVHMHLSDNDGKSDQHLGIGDGTVNWTKVAELTRKASFSGIAVIESVKNIEGSVRNAKRFFS